jgi:hypothetical protein
MKIEMMKQICDTMEEGRLYTVEDLIKINPTIPEKAIKCNRGIMVSLNLIEAIVDLELNQKFYRKNT